MRQSTSALGVSGSLRGSGAQFGSADGRGDDSRAEPDASRRLIARSSGLQACALCRPRRRGRCCSTDLITSYSMALQRLSFRHDRDLQQRPIHQAMPGIGSGAEVSEPGSHRDRQCVDRRHRGHSGAVRGSLPASTTTTRTSASPRRRIRRSRLSHGRLGADAESGCPAAAEFHPGAGGRRAAWIPRSARSAESC